MKGNYHKQQGTVYILQTFVSCTVARNTSTAPSVATSILRMWLDPLSQEGYWRGKWPLKWKGFKSCILNNHRKEIQLGISCLALHLKAAHPDSDTISYCLFLMLDV